MVEPEPRLGFRLLMQLPLKFPKPTCAYELSQCTPLRFFRSFPSAGALPSRYVLLSYPSPVLRLHPPPCSHSSISLPYRKSLFPLLFGDSEGFPSPVPVLSVHVAANTPEMPTRLLPSLSVSTCRLSADFVHKIGTRPSLFMIFTKLPLRSLSLRPGRLRCTLSGYVVESLSTCPFPAMHRFLATRPTEPWPWSGLGVLSALTPLTRQDREQFTLALTSSGSSGSPASAWSRSKSGHRGGRD